MPVDAFIVYMSGGSQDETGIMGFVTLRATLTYGKPGGPLHTDPAAGPFDLLFELALSLPVIAAFYGWVVQFDE